MLREWVRTKVLAVVDALRVLAIVAGLRLDDGEGSER